ncbi:MAG TPA: hypothetical protein VNS34_10510 [Rhizobiaceae bacterium]|nr:hypothetical protein [Rhizobiaceae bacterium]
MADLAEMETTMLFLKDIYGAKQARGDADAEQFRALAIYEFGAGLNATAIGAAHILRSVTKNRRAWVSDVQHARRVAALADIDAALSPVAEAA